MHPRDLGRGPGEAKGSTEHPGVWEDEIGEEFSPLPSPSSFPRHTQHTDSLELRPIGAAAGLPRAPQHTKPRPRTHSTAEAGAHAHTIGPRAPHRGPSPGSPPARRGVRPPCTPAPGDAAWARARRATAARPPGSALRRKFAGRPPTHRRRCSAAGTAAPAATWRGRRSRCPAPSLPLRPRR